MNKPYFTRLAMYNAWANGVLYDACAALPREVYHAQRPAFFGSIHRTLNHLLVADIMWLVRLEGTPPPDLQLDTELHATFEALRAAREDQDERIRRYVDGLAEADLAGEIVYRNSRGEGFAQNRWTILQHVFNHHTHHRGQVHDMLSATDQPPPPLDLIYFTRLHPEA